MNWEELTYDETQNLPEQDLQEIESSFGLVFPEEFRNFIRVANGGYIEESDFDFTDAYGEQVSSGIGMVLRFDDSATPHISEVHQRLGKFQDSKIIPFAETGGGDYICLNFARSAVPQIAYFFHELGEYVFLANDFESFIAKLYLPADVEADRG